MYGRSFEDPDGHIGKSMWMDPAAAEQGASALQDLNRAGRSDATADLLAVFKDEPAGRSMRQHNIRKENGMTYVEGFIVRRAEANKEAYRKHAADAAPLFKEFGVKRTSKPGTTTFPRARSPISQGGQAKDDEKVVFSWFEYPDKATRDAANEKMMSDPRMKEMGANMPFDGKRMIIGGFDAIVEEGSAARRLHRRLRRAGAQRQEATLIARWPRRWPKFPGTWRDARRRSLGDDVPNGKVTDFKRAVKAEDGEKSSSPSSNGPTRRPATRPGRRSWTTRA